MTATKELTIFNFYWLKLALLHVQIAVKNAIMGKDLANWHTGEY